MMNRLSCLSVAMLLLPSISATAADWSAFRGPLGNGVSDAVNVPVEWSADDNIAWKVDLPGQSNGSPVISGKLLFLTSATEDGRQRHLHCFATEDGSPVWTKTVTLDEKMPTHETNLYGGSTPATDGRLVVVWHASAGLLCYDIDGNELWKRDLGGFRHQWGYGTSPILHEGKVILHSGPGANVFVAAFDLTSGDTIWKTDEPVENDGELNNDKKYMGSWSTPVITSVDGRPVVVCSLATRVNGYDPDAGEILWTCNGLRGERGDLAYTSPIIADDICVSMGGFKGPAIGFRMGGHGDITDSRRIWRDEENNPQRIATGVYVDGHVYTANAGPNTLECIDPQTGETKWRQRNSDGAFWGSVIHADGRLYATDQKGTTTVFQPNPQEFERIAVNQLDDDGNSTPAVADGAIYIRTFRHLYRIGLE